jgi:hypothetical protein
MKRALFVALVLFAREAYSQLTLELGDTFSSNIMFTNPPGISGQNSPGYVCVSLIPDTFQAGDAVRLEIFDAADTNLLSWSQTYTAPPVCGAPSPFGFWDQNGSFRVTMLSGSATIFRVEAFVATGPFFCPCNGYSWAIAPSPKLKISRSADSVQVSWSTNAVGFILESTPSLSPINWTPVTSTPTVVGDYFVMTVQGTGGFFRLQKPR